MDARIMEGVIGDAEARLAAVREWGQGQSAKAAALDAVVTNQAARIRELENAVRWACGEIGDFPGEDTSKGRYHWRRELRLRAGVPFVPPSETIAEPK